MPQQVEIEGFEPPGSRIICSAAATLPAMP